MYHIYLPLTILRAKLGLSERELTKRIKISRGCLRKLGTVASSLRIESVVKLATFFNRRVETLIVPDDVFSEYSTIATALRVEQAGLDSWKIYFMDFVDEFRRSLDPRLILLPPHSKFDSRLFALLASTVCALCEELGISIPLWAKKRYFLDSPWFVSGSNSLKASALVESPLAFRRNNIFVQANFIERA